MFDDARKRWWALYVLCSGVLMIVLDTTIVNVALPSIREDLAFSETSLVWVVNAYMLTFGGFLLLGGRLGDLFGHRRLFLLGLILFTAASVGCGLAHLAAHADRRARRAGPGRRGRHGGGAVAHHGSVHRERANARRPWASTASSVRRAAASACCSAASSPPRSTGTGSSSSTCRSARWCMSPACGCCRMLPGTRERHEARRRGRDHGHRVADARGVRHRQRPRGRLALDRRPWRRSAAAVALLDRVPHHRIARAGAADAARPVPPAQCRHRQHRGRAVGRGDVRVVLHLRALSAARAGLQRDAGGPVVPAGEPHHGGVLARAVGEDRHALRHPRDRWRSGCCAPRRASRCSRARRSTAISGSTCCRA